MFLIRFFRILAAMSRSTLYSQSNLLRESIMKLSVIQTDQSFHVTPCRNVN